MSSRTSCETEIGRRRDAMSGAPASPSNGGRTPRKVQGMRLPTSHECYGPHRRRGISRTHLRVTLHIARLDECGEYVRVTELSHDAEKVSVLRWTREALGTMCRLFPGRISRGQRVRVVTLPGQWMRSAIRRQHRFSVRRSQRHGSQRRRKAAVVSGNEPRLMRAFCWLSIGADVRTQLGIFDADHPASDGFPEIRESTLVFEPTDRTGAFSAAL